MDEALKNSVGVLSQIAALLADVQADRAAVAAQILDLTAQRDANALQASSLNREVFDLREKLATYEAHPDVLAAKKKRLEADRDAAAAELERLEKGYAPRDDG